MGEGMSRALSLGVLRLPAAAQDYSTQYPRGPITLRSVVGPGTPRCVCWWGNAPQRLKSVADRKGTVAARLLYGGL